MRSGAPAEPTGAPDVVPQSLLRYDQLSITMR